MSIRREIYRLQNAHRESEKNCFDKTNLFYTMRILCGEMAEWLNAAVLKTAEGVSPS